MATIGEATLRETQWLAGKPAMQPYFRAVESEVARLIRPGDNFSKITFEAPFAGRAILERRDELRKRETFQPYNPPNLEEQRQASAAHFAEEAQWSAYVRHLEQLRLELKHERHVGDIFEYLGLEDNDLASPLDPENPEAQKFSGRRAGWPLISIRIESALRKWLMTPEHERSLIPLVNATNRNTRAIDELARRQAANEKRIDALARKIGELDE